MTWTALAGASSAMLLCSRCGLRGERGERVRRLSERRHLSRVYAPLNDRSLDRGLVAVRDVAGGSWERARERLYGLTKGDEYKGEMQCRKERAEIGSCTDVGKSGERGETGCATFLKGVAHLQFPLHTLRNANGKCTCHAGGEIRLAQDGYYVCFCWDLTTSVRRSNLCAQSRESRRVVGVNAGSAAASRGTTASTSTVTTTESTTSLATSTTATSSLATAASAGTTAGGSRELAVDLDVDLLFLGPLVLGRGLLLRNVVSVL